MKFQARAIRTTTALVIAGIIASQIPMRGDVALGSIQQPRDSYLNPVSDNSGSFLGIRGFSNRNAITGLGFALVGVGIYANVLDSRRSSSTAPETSSETTSESTRSIYDTIKAAPDDFSGVAQMIDDADLKSTLSKKGSFTFLSPTNHAISLSSEACSKLSRKDLSVLIQDHIIIGKYTINDLRSLKSGTRLKTLSNKMIIISNTDNLLSIDQSEIVQNDIISTNGIIHPINRIIIVLLK